MRLTLFSDYSLRLLVYLTCHSDRVVPLSEVSRAYGISKNHLVKVQQLLLDHGLVASTRGRGGGLRLARPATAIKVGAVVRLTEPDFDLVECFDRKTNTCPIEPACQLKRVLREARSAFLDSLDAYTLADLTPRGGQLVRLWARKLDALPNASESA
jgi:Rrf2 family nitric oxide-sensitive transcriptional repressor